MSWDKFSSHFDDTCSQSYFLSETTDQQKNEERKKEADACNNNATSSACPCSSYSVRRSDQKVDSKADKSTNSHEDKNIHEETSTASNQKHEDKWKNDSYWYTEKK